MIKWKERKWKNKHTGIGVSSFPGRLALAAFLTAAILFSGMAAGATAAGVKVKVRQERAGRIIIDYELDGFTSSPVIIEGREYSMILLGKENPIKVKGAPELPNVCRSIIIPDDSEMSVRVIDSSYREIFDIQIAPSKGVLPRKVNPAGVPYTFGPAYETNAFYPAELASLREPYILRDHRGVVVELNPFRYNPVSRTLRFYSKVTLEVVGVGPGRTNVLHRSGRGCKPSRSFNQIYARHFLNYFPPERYSPPDENGGLLIICHNAWLPDIQPLVTHKNNAGTSTTAVGVSTIGNNAASIKNYIQNVYDAGDLAFVLLVGDATQVASPQVTVGFETGSADPTYALLAGSDHYPDILVGRFSAQNSSQVATQVERTCEYEQLPALAQSWFKRGAGIASDEGPGHHYEYDYEHMNYIRADLLGYGYTSVDRIYDPGATASQVSAAVNAGRGIINYCGHGDETSWSTTGFSTTEINALTNDNQLPFIFDVACNNGTFDGNTCFAEAWLRATHGSEPSGAIAIYASSVGQHWDPPMTAQDEAVDLLCAESCWSFGALCFAGACKMIDDYGSSGEEMFDTWHVFGDPSVRIRPSTSFLPSFNDYNGDGTSDIAVFRGSSGLWLVRGMTRVYFGNSDDLPQPGDYNGDGTTEIGVFREGSGMWAIKNLTRLYLGSSGDEPVPGDYDGDGSCDVAVFRVNTGVWAIRGITRIYFGSPGDNPAPGYYDGGASKSVGIFRPSSGLWAIREFTRVYFGGAGDQAVPGDYGGNGCWQCAIFRPSAGLWAVRGVTVTYFGGSSDRAVPADYDGDSRDDIALFRSSSGLWMIRGITQVYHGSSGDMPVSR